MEINEIEKIFEKNQWSQKLGFFKKINKIDFLVRLTEWGRERERMWGQEGEKEGGRERENKLELLESEMRGDITTDLIEKQKRIINKYYE